MFKIFAFFLIWGYNWIKDFLYLICIKMNKFRVNLHSAFLDVERSRESSRDQFNEAVRDSEKEVKDLQNEMSEKFGFDFMNKLTQAYEDTKSQYQSLDLWNYDKERFLNRLNTKEGNKIYRNILVERLNQGL